MPASHSEMEEGHSRKAEHVPAAAHRGATYGAAETGDINELQDRRTKDRLGGILGGMAVVALVLGLVQVSDMGGQRSVAVGDEARYRSGLKAASAISRHVTTSTSLGAAKPRLHPVQLQEDTEANGTAAENAAGDANTTTEAGAAEEATAEAEAPATADAEKCCACEEAPVEDAPAAPAGNESAPTVEPAAEPAAAKTRTGGQMLQRRKLLQEEGTASAADAPAAGGNESDAPEAAAPAEGDAGALSGCCPCKSKVHMVKKVEDFSSDAMPRTVYDDTMSLFKSIGEGMWGETGYKTAYSKDGVRVVPTPEFPEHKMPTVGPRDIMVPSLEYEGEQHNGGWVVTDDFFGDGIPHEPTDETPTEAEINSVAKDKMVDQRITYMGEGANARGRQLPGVSVDWSKIPSAARAAKEGVLYCVCVCGRV